MKKQLAALLLLSAMLLASCSEKPSDPASGDPEPAEDPGAVSEVSEAEPETELDTKDYVPEMTFEKEINFLLPDVSWLTRDIITDEQTGERVNDAQNALKLEMESRFGTTLSEHFTGDIWSTAYI